MQYSRLADIPKPQQERLAYIEFRLLFLGAANRPDVVRRFGVSASAASRDFALYRQLASSNLHYDRSNAVYLPSLDFSPLYHYAPAQVLTALAEGFGDDFVARPASWLPSEMPIRLNVPAVDILIPISRALYGGKALRLTYHSLSSGTSLKEVAPLVLVDNGLRWHLRAYEPERARYADFVLNRISHAELGEPITAVESIRQQDSEWQQQIELELAPHPQLLHPDTIAYEYGMTDQRIKVSVRAALAGYLLRRWNVDCSPDHHLIGAEYHLWLSNVEQLQKLHKIAIAPGFIGAVSTRSNEGWNE